MTYPAPKVPCEWIELTDPRVPKGARGIAKKAEKAGWNVRARYVRGVLPNTDGTPQHRTERHSVYDENGNPALTPTGRQATTAETTDKLRTVDHLMLRMRDDNGASHRVAFVEYVDGKATWTGIGNARIGQLYRSGLGTRALASYLATRTLPDPRAAEPTPLPYRGRAVRPARLDRRRTTA